MSEIPYFFETPVPKYFRETGWFNNENTFKFVTWAFARCSTQSHKVIMDGKEIILEPFEFIAGRYTNSQDCFLTEKQFRGQLFSMVSLGILKKGANSRANRFTTYIWVTERFCKNKDQQKGPLRADSGPTKGHNQEDKKIRSKESHHPQTPSSHPDPEMGPTDDLLQTFDFTCLVSGKPKTVKIPLPDLQRCIEIKGSHEKVLEAIEYVLRSPGRKFEIYDWPKTLARWEIKSNVKPRLKENIECADRLVKLYESAPGYRCEIYTCSKKDQRGILFYSSASTGNPESIFIPFIDPEFIKKCFKTIKLKKMQKGRIPHR